MKKSLGEIISDAVKSVFNAEAEVKEKMAEATLEDGTILTAEAFEEGQVLYIATAEGDFVVAPAGEYTLTDGTVLTVNDEGVIAAIVAGAEPTEAKEDEEDKEEMSKYVTREDFERFATELLSAVTKIVKVNQSAEKKTDVSDEQKAKVEAAKAEFSRRKKIGEKTEVKEPESKSRQFKHTHVHPIKARIKEAFQDFDYN